MVVLPVSQVHTCKHKNVIAPHSFIPTDSLTDCAVVQYVLNINCEYCRCVRTKGVSQTEQPLPNINEICWIFFSPFLFEKKQAKQKRSMKPNLTLFIIIIVILIIIVIKIIYFHCLVFFYYITCCILWILLPK